MTETLITIPFSLRTSVEDITSFATMKGWTAQVANGVDANGDFIMITNPVSAQEYATNIAKKKIAEIFAEPFIKQVEVTKTTEIKQTRITKEAELNAAVNYITSSMEQAIESE